MKNTLEEVLKIEGECEKTKKDARHKAKIIKDEAAVLGKEHIKQRKHDANHRGAKIIKKANRQADAHISHIKDETEVEYKSLTMIAERNINKAAKLILEKVVSSL